MYEGRHPAYVGSAHEEDSCDSFYDSQLTAYLLTRRVAMSAELRSARTVPSMRLKFHSTWSPLCGMSLT